MARYKTKIHWGGPTGTGHTDADLDIQIANREQVMPPQGAKKIGTSVTWYSPEGNGDMTFHEDGKPFKSNAQFPGEEPVWHRGTLN